MIVSIIIQNIIDGPLRKNNAKLDDFIIFGIIIIELLVREKELRVA
jgi:hypothetical protein